MAGVVTADAVRELYFSKYKYSFEGQPDTQYNLNKNKEEIETIHLRHKRNKNYARDG